MKLPDKQECDRMLRECETPEGVVRHCRAVAEYARSIADRLKSAGVMIDENAVFAAALLHDCKKAESGHARAAGDFLVSKGYSGLAKIIAAHHDLPEPEKLDEAAVLYYADKRFKEDKKVTIAERFAGSLSKCKTEEAKAARQKRLRAALSVEKLIKDALGPEFKDF